MTQGMSQAGQVAVKNHVTDRQAPEGTGLARLRVLAGRNAEPVGCPYQPGGVVQEGQSDRGGAHEATVAGAGPGPCPVSLRSAAEL
jgi:hypothetical protein